MLNFLNLNTIHLLKIIDPPTIIACDQQLAHYRTQLSAAFIFNLFNTRAWRIYK